MPSAADRRYERPRGDTVTQSGRSVGVAPGRCDHADVREREWNGRVGRLESGRYAGMFVEVELDPSGTGFHIWLLDRHPRKDLQRVGTCGRTRPRMSMSGSAQSSSPFAGSDAERQLWAGQELTRSYIGDGKLGDQQADGRIVAWQAVSLPCVSDARTPHRASPVALTDGEVISRTKGPRQVSARVVSWRCGGHPGGARAILRRGPAAHE